jgi:hypothetical protein
MTMNTDTFSDAIRRHFAITVCGAGLLLLSTAATAADATPTNLLANPTLQDADGDKVPDKWRSSAPDGSETVKVEMDAAGGVHILDQDKANGVGLAQYVAVEPGHKYKFSASAKGSGTLWFYVQFLDAIPAREGDISKHRLTETRQSMTDAAEFKEFSVQATAPTQAKQARVWFYCPKIGVTDSIVKSASLEDLGAVPPSAVPVVAGSTPATAGSGATTNGTTTLVNPDLKDADADNLPDGWRVFPDADGTNTKVAMAAAGGVQIVDTDKTKGIGIQQQLPAQAGVAYSLSAKVKGTSNISLNFQFLSDKPARDSDLRKLLINNKTLYATGTPEGKETTLTATAPAGTKFMRVWLYCPNIGVTDVVVEKVSLTSAAAPVAAVGPTNDKLIFVGDFESNSFEGWQTQFPHSTKGSIVTTPVRAGKYALRNELTYADFKTYGDSRNRRSEVYTENVGKPGEERWYGFSIYLPKGWEELETFDIVMQIHNKPDAGEGPKSPIMTLETHGKDWSVNNRWDKEKISKPAKNGAGGTITTNRLWTGPYETEKWTDWVFHVKWSLEDDGLIEVWKDGQKIAEQKGPNGYNDEQPYYMKIGVYKPAYRVTAPPQRVIFHDEVRIGNEKASYADVAPPAAPKQ